MADSNVAVDSGVSPDTDDLDAFSDMFFGNTPAKAEATDNEDDEISETPSATDDSEESNEESKSDKDEDGEDAPADEDKDEDPDEEDKSLLKVKGRKPARERINELTAKAREAERERDALRRELEDFRSQKESKPQDVVSHDKATPLDSGAPNPDTILEDGSPKYPLGEFDPIYIRDLTRFTIQQENEAVKKEAKVAREAEEMETAERELLSSWNDKLRTSSERLPDLSEKVVDLEDTFAGLDPSYGKYLAATIMSLDYGPDVLDYLADHLDEARKIVAAGPTSATIALGRIEARFYAAAEAKETSDSGKGKVGKSTEAPPPPPRNKGSGGKQAVSPDTDDLEAFEKLYFAKK